MSVELREEVLLTGYGVAIPGWDMHERLLLADSLRYEQVFDPAEKLGKKGLRYKEEATLLALCAALDALQRAGFVKCHADKLADVHFGVVAASNTSNLDTVCRVASEINQGHVMDTSSMDLPNASSNILSATLAIRFGLKAMNLMVCSGASASADALVMAVNAIRNGRAQRMLVVGVEVDAQALRSLGNGANARTLAHGITSGAAALVLESASSAADREFRSEWKLLDHELDAGSRRGEIHMDAMLRTYPHKRRYVSSWPHRAHDYRLEGGGIQVGALIGQAYGARALMQVVGVLQFSDETHKYVNEAETVTVPGGGAIPELEANQYSELPANLHTSSSPAFGAIVQTAPGWGDRRSSVFVIGYAHDS